MTGSGRIFATLDHYLVVSQLSSFGTAFLFVFGVIFVVFRSARFGVLGIIANALPVCAVLGLMAVMQNLTDPSKLGTGIAAAFTATVYGIGLANLFLLPIAAKLRTAALAQSRVREMVIEGMIALAQGENPRSIDTRLQSYLH